ncbi:MAG: hypothetical protein AAGN46_02040 [Acidobacteriota bacterium]
MDCGTAAWAIFVVIYFVASVARQITKMQKNRPGQDGQGPVQVEPSPWAPDEERPPPAWMPRQDADWPAGVPRPLEDTGRPPVIQRTPAPDSPPRPSTAGPTLIERRPEDSKRPQPASERPTPSEHERAPGWLTPTPSEHQQAPGWLMPTPSEHQQLERELAVRASEHRVTPSEHRRTESEHRKGDVEGDPQSVPAFVGSVQSAYQRRRRIGKRGRHPLLVDLHGRSSLARAVLLREVLGPPLGLREHGDLPGSGSG